MFRQIKAKIGRQASRIGRLWGASPGRGVRRSPRPELEALEDRQLLTAASLAVAQTMAHSPEYYDKVVTATYQRYLGRAPEVEGLNSWASAMRAGAVTGEQMEAGFVGSPEYIAQHGGTGSRWVRGMYEDLLRRAPDDGEVRAWTEALEGGMGPTEVALEFAASQERETLRVQGLYRTYLGREPDAAGVDAWVNHFLQGATNEDLISGIVGSDEYFEQQCSGSPRTFLLQAYQQILDRRPDQAELGSWLTQFPGQQPLPVEAPPVVMVPLPAEALPPTAAQPPVVPANGETSKATNPPAQTGASGSASGDLDLLAAFWAAMNAGGTGSNSLALGPMDSFLNQVNNPSAGLLGQLDQVLQSVKPDSGYTGLGNVLDGWIANDPSFWNFSWANNPAFTGGGSMFSMNDNQNWWDALA